MGVCAQLLIDEYTDLMARGRLMEQLQVCGELLGEGGRLGLLVIGEEDELCVGILRAYLFDKERTFVIW